MTRWLMAVLGLLVVIWVGAAIAQWAFADQLPARVPVHWGADLQPDSWVDRGATFQIFYLMPTVITAVAALLIALPWVSPLKYKVEPFRPVYDYILFLVVGMFAWVFAVIIHGQVNGELRAPWFIGGFFLFFGLIGNVLGKVRKNFWVGIRTPWTLANDIVWERTHRLGAWLFVAAGFLGFALTLAGVPWFIGFGLIMTAALLPVVYSLVIYKKLERAGRLESNGA